MYDTSKFGLYKAFHNLYVDQNTPFRDTIFSAYVSMKHPVLKMKFWLKIFLLGCGIYLLVTICFFVGALWKSSDWIFTESSDLSPAPVALVFGAGLQRNGEPSDILKDRLRQASVLYHEQHIQKLLLTGDNSYEYYNEPASMKQFLVQSLHVQAEDIVLDYGGRRTFDSCIRAREIWGVNQAILVSQSYHLKRALVTCSILGMEVQGYSASRQNYLWQNRFFLREILAQVKAYMDLFLWRPSYLKGSQETDFQELFRSL